MNTVTPIIVLMHTTSEPERCPSCKAVESKKTVCAHCGYEYDEEDSTVWVIFLVIVILCLGLGAIFYVDLTLWDWLGSWLGR